MPRPRSQRRRSKTVPERCDDEGRPIAAENDDEVLGGVDGAMPFSQGAPSDRRMPSVGGEASQDAPGEQIPHETRDPTNDLEPDRSRPAGAKG